MCELLVRVVDKVNASCPYLDAACTKRGDVIVVCLDGWAWSEAERTNPDWRILRFPKVTVEQAQAFLAPEMGEHQTDQSRMLQARGFKLDVDHPELADGLSLKRLMNLKVRKKPLQDPNVFEAEQNPNVFEAE